MNRAAEIERAAEWAGIVLAQATCTLRALQEAPTREEGIKSAVEVNDRALAWSSAVAARHLAERRAEVDAEIARLPVVRRITVDEMLIRLGLKRMRPPISGNDLHPQQRADLLSSLPPNLLTKEPYLPGCADCEAGPGEPCHCPPENP